ncbi:IclR family transcriptional regulator [Labrenzia sp. PHM005]|uniref:IclR family transcriptional regulator n=1 Tax=Labrenzia sp. PHM005 TaxID=2590016 RepID=UPI0011404605|nr:helix-turn-helix domain-containing protein [Labrenzia sp. PHM005]QDG78289.1 helix-turn-helix domain-containing protein [Labrenzia sp. PHM005]
MPDLKDDKRYANTLARGLSVLRAFRPTDNGLGNLEISERTGLPRSTVSRLTFTLCALGYLTHGRHHDKYRLGPSALALGNIAAAAFGFIETATPIMQKLANDTKTLIGVAIQDDGEMLMVKTWRPENSATIWLNVGYRMPVLKSSTGAAYIGAMNEAERNKIMSILPEDQTDECMELWARSQDHLLANGYMYLTGGDRFSASINALATPYRPSEFSEPVAFLSGAAADVLTEARMNDSVGPELAAAVEQLRHVTGQHYSVLLPV